MDLKIGDKAVKYTDKKEAVIIKFEDGDKSICSVVKFNGNIPVVTDNTILVDKSKLYDAPLDNWKQWHEREYIRNKKTYESKSRDLKSKIASLDSSLKKLATVQKGVKEFNKLIDMVLRVWSLEYKYYSSKFITGVVAFNSEMLNNVSVGFREGKWEILYNGNPITLLKDEKTALEYLNKNARYGAGYSYYISHYDSLIESYELLGVEPPKDLVEARQSKIDIEITREYNDAKERLKRATEKYELYKQQYDRLQAQVSESTE